MLIQNQKEFDQLFYELKEQDLLAIDLEFIRKRTFFAQPALIQLAWKNKRVAVVDLLEIDISQFRSIWQNPKVNKIIHSSEQDVEILFNLMGVYPESLFDSQIALQFMIFSESISYQSLIELLFEVHLDKSMQMSDWLKRPLEPKAIEYAKNDVLWLYLCFAKLVKGLKILNREDWFRQEMNRILNHWKIRFDSKQYYKTMNQYSRIEPEYQDLLKRFSIKREELAKSLNLPRTWVCSDTLLLRFLRTQPKNNNEFYLVLKKDSCHKKFIKLMFDFFSKPKNQVNKPYRLKKIHISPREKEEILKLKNQILFKAEEDQIHSNLILKTQDLQLLFKGYPNNIYEKTWRKDWLTQHQIIKFS